MNKKAVEGCKLKTLMALCLMAWGINAPAHAAAKVVISQVYGGGGNSGAIFKSDFIELFNAGDQPADLTGWSVQYASATGSSWQKTAINGVLLAGQYYLVQQSTGTGGSVNLPSPEAIGTLLLSASSGKVALVKNNLLLACGAQCSGNANVLDYVGFGSANNAETNPIALLSNSTAALRKNAGCTDSNDNSADFIVTTPAPRNGATLLHTCGGVSPTPTPTPSSQRIHDIQGHAHRSPLENTMVSNVPGVVTLLASNGFYLQDPLPDNDPLTSEGIFVFVGSAPTVVVGDSVLVSGTVSEFRPGGTGGTNNLTTTQIKLASGGASKLSSGNALPAPVILASNVPNQRLWQGNVADIEQATTLDLANGLDFYESLEGMRVQINGAVVVGPSNKFGEVFVVADHGRAAGPRSPRGGVVVTEADFNPERIKLAAGAIKAPAVNVGDWFPQAVGVVDYSFANYNLQLSELAAPVSSNLQPETTVKQTSDELAIASFNVENLDANEGGAKFARLAVQIVQNLQSPDILGLMEIQDNNGATSDGSVDPAQTLAKLITAIKTAGGPAYQYRQINPVDGQDGGEPGGNIRQVFLFNPARVSFIDRAGGSATQGIDVVACPEQACLTASPGRIAPTDPAFNASRKPLTGEFSFNGNKLFVIANHFNSKGGDQPLSGRFQPANRSSEVQRNKQAQIVADFVSRINALDRNANVVVLGDINDYQFSTSVQRLKAVGLVDLVETLPENERYTYVYEGNSQVLDHILVSPALASRAQYDVVHVNSEFADQASDHEPEVAKLTLPQAWFDITARFSQQKSGLVYNAGSKTFNGSLSLAAQSVVSGPVRVQIKDLPAGVTLANGAEDGVLLANITAGTALVLPLKFNNPARVAIRFTAQILANKDFK
ncbi:lamin tail domain-containing protein [Iodobacter sp.]|uniref:lamin tail domain-containing protein n=1 Tax=Iodobacter sp. TaxID=1915058 RepID=UPI0025F406EE|nr:lamin tail domain-containing protein [Iodobacter sp.]